MELDHTYRNVLERELQQLEGEIEQRQAAAAYIRSRLGLPAEGNATPNGVSEQGPGIVGRRVADSINDMQYFGLSANKAAAEVLHMVGKSRPLTTRELYEAITKGGISVKDTDVLGKMMKKSPLFHRLGEGRGGRWGLAEWYGAARRRRGTDEDEPESASDEAAGSDEFADAEGEESD